MIQLNYEQSKHVFGSRSARDLVESLSKYLNQDTLATIADCGLFDCLVSEDRVLSKGRNKGKRIIKLWDRPLTDAERDTLAKFLTGQDTSSDAYSVGHFFGSDRNNMFQILFDANYNGEFHYQCHWYYTYVKLLPLVDKLLPHLRNEINNKTFTDSEQWFAKNRDQYIPLTGDQYNEWFFSQKKIAA